MRPIADRPIRLRPDNLTPATRTPWGGDKILGRYKAGLGLGVTGQVGESWELSVEPDLPAMLAEAPMSLGEAIATDPVGFLGPVHAALWGSTALLVKLLDSAIALSVQIHPHDDDPGLSPYESGKPEAWVVIEAEPGAGIYLGLAGDADADRIREAVHRGHDLSRLLTFVPVEPGDFFVIEPGTPHAVGAGITLVEPQRVLPGRRGVTYRYWDWNRLYDATGHPGPDGQPRSLHLERALEVTRWDRPRGDALLTTVRRRHGAPRPDDSPRRTDLAEGLRCDELGVERVEGTGALTVPATPLLRCVTVVAGQLTIHDPGFAVTARRGESLVLPAAMAETRWLLEGAVALLSWVR